MRKIKILEHISLDGMIAPGDRDDDSDYARGGWMAPYRSATGREAVTEAQGSGFDLLLGRRTYDLWSGFWPRAEKSPLADSFNAATKYVATHRPESLGWGPAGGLGGDIVEGVRRLKSEEGPNLVVWGSATLASVLIKQALVDDLVLIVYPVLFGRGIRLFTDGADPRQFALVGTRATTPGVLINSYRYVGPLRTG